MGTDEDPIPDTTTATGETEEDEAVHETIINDGQGAFFNDEETEQQGPDEATALEPSSINEEVLPTDQTGVGDAPLHDVTLTPKTEEIPEDTTDPAEAEGVSGMVEAAAATTTNAATEGGEEEKDARVTTSTPPTVVWDPAEADVLSGRGASVNAHAGNKKFRALCFARKPEFEAGNHAAKRRIATEIVLATLAESSSTSATSTTTPSSPPPQQQQQPARFLKRKDEKGPWQVMTTDQAILKACQVMRDYKRPDRLAMREMQSGNARKRQRTQESTPILDIPIPTLPLAPIIENPFGVHDHDVLCGRGAFVNGHTGNARLRDLAQTRKRQFDSGNYSEKRTLATEVVQYIRSLDPPGRFLRRVNTAPKPTEGDDDNWIMPPRGLDGTWEELNDEKAIHKACQVMRDIDRPDRKDREIRRKTKKGKSLKELAEEKAGLVDGKPIAETTTTTTTPGSSIEPNGADKPEAANESSSATTGATNASTTKDSMTMLAETSTTAEKAAVDEAVAATEAALDKALHSVAEQTGESMSDVTGSVMV